MEKLELAGSVLIQGQLQSEIIEQGERKYVSNKGLEIMINQYEEYEVVSMIQSRIINT